MKYLVKAFLVAMLVSASVAWAQAQMQPPKPGPDLKKLDYFAGNWKTDGMMNSGPGVVGGKYSSTDHAFWFTGGFFLVDHSKFTAPTGTGESVEVMGYDTNAGDYTFERFDSLGRHETAKGTVNGNTWTWASQLNMGAQSIKTRFVEKVLSPNSYQFHFEISPDGTNWSTVMEGTATRVTAGETQK